MDNKAYLDQIATKGQQQKSISSFTKMLDFKAENADAGSVDVELTFTAHNGKVGDVDEKWTCFAPQSYTNSILRVAEHGKVIATLVPEQTAIHLGETKYVDHETGEVLA